MGGFPAHADVLLIPKELCLTRRRRDEELAKRRINAESGSKS